MPHLPWWALPHPPDLPTPVGHIGCMPIIEIIDYPLTKEDEARAEGFGEGFRAAMKEVLERIKSHGKQDLAAWVDQQAK